MLFHHQVPKYNTTPYSQIMPNVFIGSYESVTIFGNMFPGPALVINCTPDVPPPRFCGEFIRVPVWDNLDPEECKQMFHYLNSSQVLEKIHNRIQRGEQVLIHCVAGMQRSCAVLACYLCRYHGMTTQEAVTFIQRQRPIAFRGGVNFADTIYQYNPLPIATPL